MISLEPTLGMAFASILFSPFFWNATGRLQYHYQIFSKCGLSSESACRLFAVLVFTFSMIRNVLVYQAIMIQPTVNEWLKVSQPMALMIFPIGIVLVLGAFVRLGIVGTYLGDHFGILMKERITGFPFSIVDNPMYIGSTLCFYGMSLCPAGLVLSTWVFIVYRIALMFEEYAYVFIHDEFRPFTDAIYTKKK